MWNLKGYQKRMESFNSGARKSLREASLSDQDKKEIEAIHKQGWKHMNMNLAKKLAPKAAQYIQKQLESIHQGRMSFDEAGSVFTYLGSEIAETVYGSEGYDYYKSL